MISYAQNQEDVVLARLVSVIEKGCYVDVGAAHPVLDNVTYALYLAGWRGVNIEPMHREMQMLIAERPEDTTLQIAISDRAETVTLFEAPLENRGATTSNEATVERYRDEGQMFEKFDVEALPLTTVWSRHVNGDVHLLKIDVEGMETQVLAGADLSVTKPWVLVIEATVPNSQTQTWQEWEPMVIEANYVFTLFDGLNRFYVHGDHADLIPLLSTPANVFDNWVSHRTVLAEERAKRSEDHSAGLEEQAMEFNFATRTAIAYADELHARLVDKELYLHSVVDRAQRAEEFAGALAKERESTAAHMVWLADQADLVTALRGEVKALTRQVDDLKTILLLHHVEIDAE